MMKYLLASILYYTPWFWFAVAVLCTVIEGITLGLTTIWFALSAVLMIFISLLQLPFYAQCLLFAVIALLLLVFTRPLALKFLHTPQTKTNADSLIGKKAQVIKSITEWEKGQVKVNSTVWTATSIGGATILAKDECIIEKIEGVTLLVRKI